MRGRHPGLRMIVMSRPMIPAAARPTRRTLLAVLGLGTGAGVLAACGGGGNSGGNGDGASTVIAPCYPIAFLAQRIGGDHLEVVNLATSGADAHGLELSVRQVQQLRDAALVVQIAGFQAAIDDAISTHGDENVLEVAEAMTMLPSGGHEGHDHGHEEEPDEHVWTSPENCVILIEKLTEIFCEADPANAAVYRENGHSYQTSFEELDAEYREMAAGAARRTILFGDRFPFRYLAEELGLTCYAAFSGCSSESEPSASTIAFLIDKAYEERLPVVFQIEFSNGNIARAICEAVNLKIKMAADQELNVSDDTQEPVRVLKLHSCHNLTRDEFQSGETCLSLMTKNLEALRTALGAAPE